MTSLVNMRSPVTGVYRWYYSFIMVVTLGSKGSGILGLKGFMVAQVIRIRGLHLFKYLPFTSFVNTSWLNIFDVVVAAQIPPVMVFLVVYF